MINRIFIRTYEGQFGEYTLRRIKSSKSATHQVHYTKKVPEKNTLTLKRLI
jgi:hypothetical protein